MDIKAYCKHSWNGIAKRHFFKTEFAIDIVSDYNVNL